ncbi:hypothetical protein B0H66DRAFT_116017 [Apodospora peruviana]|uniref:Integral membrane protein n=1 Tax=Apodospora peruviana TaxID=516989 RepID=A0AAE0IJ10_9PEZI|nr:hypothetical protein B0H66DRAFT_116017 [Apodospora peruviana]
MMDHHTETTGHSDRAAQPQQQQQTPPKKRTKRSNSTFDHHHHRFTTGGSSLVEEAAHTSGPLWFLNPTTRYHRIQQPAAASQQPQKEAVVESVYEYYHVWRSRENRKGRHAAIVTSSPQQKKGEGEKADRHPRATNTLPETWLGIVKMATRFPVWDVSYDVATVFTLGSVIWVINGFFVWLPMVAPWTEFSNEADYGGGVTAFIGATIFEFGSALLMLEAVNDNRSDCFGWALEEALENHHPHLRHNDQECRHHHHSKRSLLGSSTESISDTTERPDKIADDTDQQQQQQPNSKGQQSKYGKRRRWLWWPTTHELTSHYLRDIGFLACLSQMIGATIFWIAGLTGLPPILNALESVKGATNGAYWLPQVIGGTGFIISSALFIIEVQEKWYIPAPNMLGWHIGLWNLVGAIGFTLCGALGFGSEASEAVEYASILSTHIGSWAFLIGSVIQWYESLDKYPITVGVFVPASLRDEKGVP